MTQNIRNTPALPTHSLVYKTWAMNIKDKPRFTAAKMNFVRLT